MVVQVEVTWSQQDKHKSHWDRNLCQGGHKDTLRQTDKGNGGLLQELHGTNLLVKKRVIINIEGIIVIKKSTYQHSGGLGTRWNPLKDRVILQLLEILLRRGVHVVLHVDLQLIAALAASNLVGRHDLDLLVIRAARQVL